MRAPALLFVVALVAGCAVLGPREAPRPYYEEVIAAGDFTDLVVEIDHAPGRAPALLAREHLLQELRNVTSKTRVSVLVQETLKDDASRTWTGEDLLALERETRTSTHQAPVAVLHVLYPAGRFEREGVAGITISGRSIGPITVFLDTIEELESPAGPLPLPRQARDEVERSTLLHETGHAMGLVDNGLPMVADHEDREHEGHSDDPESVMYWQVESLDGIRSALLHDGAVPMYFNDDDRADMRAAGGR